MKWTFRLSFHITMTCLIIFLVILPTIVASSSSIHLRSQPILIALDDDNVIKKVFRLNQYGKPQAYIQNQFDIQGSVIVDHTTRLMWQQSGSPRKLPYDQVQLYVEQVNAELLGGYDHWRLPTIEELISLLEAERQANNRYIQSSFDATQDKVWSADIRTSTTTWFVNFRSNQVNYYPNHNGCYVQVVRSLQQDSINQFFDEHIQHLQHCTDIIQENPRDSEAYTQRGTSYLHLQQYEEAISDFSKAIEFNPYSSEAYLNRGFTYARLAQYSQAIADYDKAIEIDPQFTEAYNNRGNAYTYIQKYSQAIADFNMVIKYQPQLVFFQVIIDE